MARLQQKLCRTCVERSAGNLTLTTFVGREMAQEVPHLTAEVVMIDDYRSWSVGDILVAQLGADVDKNKQVAWHVRVQNLSNGEKKALCCFPADVVIVSAILPRKRALPSWQKFAQGEWTRNPPSLPGIYPIRGAANPRHFHTARVLESARKGVKTVHYLDAADHEFSPEISGLWFWSEPLPELPEPRRD